MSAKLRAAKVAKDGMVSDVIGSVLVEWIEGIAFAFEGNGESSSSLFAPICKVERSDALLWPPEPTSRRFLRGESSGSSFA